MLEMAGDWLGADCFEGSPSKQHETICSHHCDMMWCRSLTLGYNRLTELPYDFGNLTGLTQLEFCGEDFDVLHLQGLKSLRVVCLKLYLDNDLHDVGLPVSLQSFQVCAIGYTDRTISDQVSCTRSSADAQCLGLTVGATQLKVLAIWLHGLMRVPAGFETWWLCVSTM